MGVVAAVVVVALVVGGGLAGRLYFEWAGSAALFYETDADLAAAARWLVDQQVGADTPVYVAARDKGHPTVMIEPVPPITWVGTDSLFIPAAGETGLAIFPHSAPPPPEWAAWLADGAIDGLPLAPDGQAAFEAFRIAGGTPPPVTMTGFSGRNPYLTYVGADVPTIAAGEAGTVVTAWRIDVPPSAGDLTPLIQLEDAAGNMLDRGDVYMTETDRWRVGETLIQQMAVSVPPATPPGDYALRVAWVERAADAYVPYIGADGSVGAVWAQVGVLTVTRPAAFPDAAAVRMDMRQATPIADGVTVLGWDTPPDSARPGEGLPLTIYWGAGEGAQDVTARLVLVGAGGEVELWRGEPVDGYPARGWTAGEILAGRLNPALPRDLDADSYTLVLSAGDARITLGTVRVEGVARVFEPPPVEHAINADFGGQVLLYGYNVGQSEGNLNLEIIWKALDNIVVDYKVFVHVVADDGTIVAQRDAMPRSNTYPTSLWNFGEYVVDSYVVPAPANASGVRIGLYMPQTGARLPVRDAAGNAEGDYIQITITGRGT